ncbi:MAG: hypothetical protein PHT40_03845 [Patescibacteria group bacterium]|nr:hypothetical protein [Patescibacteria group bacterium]
MEKKRNFLLTVIILALAIVMSGCGFVKQQKKVALKYFDSYESELPEISRKETVNNEIRWMWFEAPNKKILEETIKRVEGSCAKSTPIDKVIFDSSTQKIRVGDPWEAKSIKRERIKIGEREFVRCWLTKEVFFMSEIFFGYARFLQFVK